MLSANVVRSRRNRGNTATKFTFSNETYVAMPWTDPPEDGKVLLLSTDRLEVGKALILDHEIDWFPSVYQYDCSTSQGKMDIVTS